MIRPRTRQRAIERKLRDVEAMPVLEDPGVRGFWGWKIRGEAQPVSHKLIVHISNTYQNLTNSSLMRIILSKLPTKFACENIVMKSKDSS